MIISHLTHITSCAFFEYFMHQLRQHSLAIRVYYDDTDVSGVVHHSNYLKFFERGRTEALRAQGFELINLYEEMGVQFVVHSAGLEFLQPARLDQLLYVVTMVEEVRQASILYHQRIILGNSGDTESSGDSENSGDSKSDSKNSGDSLNLEHSSLNLVHSLKNPLCIAKIKLACVNRDFKPCALPKSLSTEIKK